MPTGRCRTSAGALEGSPRRAASRPDPSTRTPPPNGRAAQPKRSRYPGPTTADERAYRALLASTAPLTSPAAGDVLASDAARRGTRSAAGRCRPAYRRLLASDGPLAIAVPGGDPTLRRSHPPQPPGPAQATAVGTAQRAWPPRGDHRRPGCRRRRGGSLGSRRGERQRRAAWRPQRPFRPGHRPRPTPTWPPRRSRPSPLRPPPRAPAGGAYAESVEPIPRSPALSYARAQRKVKPVPVAMGQPAPRGVGDVLLRPALGPPARRRRPGRRRRHPDPRRRRRRRGRRRPGRGLRQRGADRPRQRLPHPLRAHVRRSR